MGSFQINQIRNNKQMKPLDKYKLKGMLWAMLLLIIEISKIVALTFILISCISFWILFVFILSLLGMDVTHISESISLMLRIVSCSISFVMLGYIIKLFVKK